MPDTTANPTPTVPVVTPSMTPGLTLLMAASGGIAAASLYYNQPLVEVIARDFPGSGRAASLLPTCSQIGYALGLLLLVPLGDGVDRRRLILAQAAALVAALAVAAMAPSLWVLLPVSIAIGVFASLAQQIVPFAAELARPEMRGRVVGQVMSGLFAGILLARTVSGTVGQHFGWRASFWLGGALALLILGLMAAFLPHSRPTVRLSYPRLMASLITLLQRQPVLRRSTLIQAGLFGCFGAFWSVLALLLAAPPFDMGAQTAGLFGIVGAVGIMAAPTAGRLADRQGAYRIIGAGICAVIASFALFAVWRSLAGLAIGCILLDLGVQSALIAHQTVIYALDPAARNRINTVFMSLMFVGGAVGSASAGIAWHAGGWLAVCGVGVALASLSLIAHLTRPAPAPSKPA